MLLTILEEQAMDSLLLGSDKQNDFMQSILHTMERQSNGNKLYLLNFVMVVHFKITRVTVRIWMYDMEERMNTLWFLSLSNLTF